jgi:putative flippase GtrA
MQISDFIVINLVSMAVTVGISVAMREVLLALHVGPIVAAAVAHFIGIGTGAIAGYIGHRRITFRSQRDVERSSLARASVGAAAPAE